MKKHRRAILVGRADTHGGCTFGLMNPEVELTQLDPKTKKEIPWHPQQTASQEYVWECHEEDRQAIADLADGDEIHIRELGDLTHGNSFMRELVSTRPSDQWLIAAENLRPWLRMKNVRTIRLIVGTGVHEFGEGSAAMTTADVLSREYKRDIQAVHHALEDFDGLGLDLAHHGPVPGNRSWLRGNVLNWYVRDMMMSALMDGDEPPALVWRGHYHNFTPTITTVVARGKVWQTHAAILPCYCLLDDHARKVTQSAPSVSIGLVAAEIVDGRIVQQHAFFRKVDLRTREAVHVQAN